MKIYRTLYDLVIDKPTEVSSRAEAILGCPYYEHEDGGLEQYIANLANLTDASMVYQIPDDKIDKYIQKLYRSEDFLGDGEKLGFYTDQGIWEDGLVVKDLINNAEILEGLYIIELEHSGRYWVDGILDFRMPRDMGKMREYGLKQLEIMREFQFYRQNFKPEVMETKNGH